MWDSIFTVPSVYLFTAAVALLIILYFRSRRSSDLPPGPRGLPVVGYLPFLGQRPHLTLSRLAEKYGDVMSLNIGGKTVIHLRGIEAIRDAFSNQGEEYSGCSDSSYLHCLLDGQGIAESEGPEWKEHRRFSLHTLRDFGFGKRSLEVRIQEVSLDLVNELKNAEGKPLDPYVVLSNCAANVICSVFFDHHYPLNDSDLNHVNGLVNKALDLLPGLDPFQGSPYPRFLTRFTRRYQEILQMKEDFHAVVQKQMKQHEDTFDSANLRDYIDVYLEERRRAAEEGTLEKSSFTLYRLACICFNLFLAGTSPVSRTMHWALKIMMVHKDVQERIQEEVDEVFGKDRIPSWTERGRLPYTEAAIEEVFRYSSVFPIGPFHSTLEETTLRGYTIPKRSTVLANLWSVHHDPKYWPDPDQFDPSRFMDPDGRFTKRDSVIPFCIGKRVCPGESLARMELFIFLTTILQRFDIQMADGEGDRHFESETHLFRKLKPYRLCAVPR